MRHTLKPLFSLFLAGFFMFGCQKKDDASEYISTKGLIENITLTTLDNKNIAVTKLPDGFKIAGYEQKNVLLVFFATWCPSCIAEIPHLVELQKKYAQDFSVIGVLLEDKSAEDVKKFAAAKGINYTVVASSENEKMAQAVGGVRGIPAMFLYAKGGKFVTNYSGAVPKELIESDITKLQGAK